MPRPLLATALIGIVGMCAPGVPDSAGAQGKMPNRIISLEETGPVAGITIPSGPDAPPNAKVFIFQQGDHVTNPTTFLQFTVNNLPWQPRGGAYSLYAYTPTLHRCHVATFNTSGASSAFPSFAFLCDERANPAWIEVFVEADDGHEAPDTGAFPILRGYSAAETARR